MNTTTPWHRLLGMVLTDLFTGRPWRLELEQELALKSQRLDILIIERRAMPRGRSSSANWRTAVMGWPISSPAEHSDNCCNII